MILIRIDLGSKLGLGHYIRVKTLIKYLKIRSYKIIVDNFTDLHFFENEKQNIVSLYKKNKFISELDDAKLFLKLIRKYKKPIIIKDSYRLKYNWEKYLSKYCKKIISIDDFTDNKHYCDIYINHNPALNSNNDLIEVIKKNNKKGCDLLLGTNFALFNTSIKKTKTKKSDITFYNGGSGNILIYKKIIESLIKNKNQKYKINLIVGPYAKNYLAIEQLFKNNHFIEIINQPPNLIHFLKHTKLFISPASTSMFESSFTKTPSLLFRFYKNQDIISDKDLEKLGHYFSLNRKDLFNTEKLVKVIKLMLENNKDIKKIIFKNSINLNKIQNNYLSFLKLN